MISAAACVTVPDCLLGSAFVATSLVKTSVTTSPYLLGPRVFCEKSTSPRLLGLGASTWPRRSAGPSGPSPR